MERTPIEELAKKIKEGGEMTEAERSMVSRLVMAVGQQFYEQTGVMFICGHGGKVEEDGLPEYVMIAPGFGAGPDVTAMYLKSKKE